MLINQGFNPSIALITNRANPY